jgi:transporter family protein
MEYFFQGRNAMISALFYSIGLYSYVKAISMEETVLIAPLYNSSSLWIFVLGFIFLGEQVTVLRVIGGILIFIGVFLLYTGNLTDKLNAIINSQGSLFMLAGSIFIAIGRTIDAYSVRIADPMFFAFLMNFYLGMYLLLATVILKRAHVIPKIVKEEPISLFWAGFSNGWAYLFLLVALRYIDLSIAEPLSLLSLLLTALLGKYLLGERLKERLHGTIVIIFGAILLFY